MILNLFREPLLTSKVLLTAVRVHPIGSVSREPVNEPLMFRICAGQRAYGGRDRV